MHINTLDTVYFFGEKKKKLLFLSTGIISQTTLNYLAGSAFVNRCKFIAFPRIQKFPISSGCQSEVMVGDLHQLLQTLGGGEETLVFDEGSPLKGRQRVVHL